MIIKNAKVLLDDFQFGVKDVRFDSVICEIGDGVSAENEEVVDAQGKMLIPGLIDIHTHGALGFEAIEEDCDFPRWKQYLMERGITTFFPTTVAATSDEVKRAVAHLKDADGMNVEGPFLSYEKKGAHDENKIVEIDLELLEQVKHKVKLTTVAPEMWGNLDKIKAVCDMGIKVSIGHTAADYDTCCRAFEKGATHVTHIFNAMSPLNHREPALIGAAAENDNVFCEVISDGFHLHPSVVRLLYKLLGADRMVLISDAIAPMGVADGEYSSGGLQVFVRDGQARLADGTIAGSTSHLLTMVQKAISFGIPAEDAVKMASLTPARAVGMDNDRGSIAVGKRADLVLVDADFNVCDVFYMGERQLSV